MDEDCTGPAQRRPLHEPVLASQILAVAAPRSGMVCLDCTLGLGGHAGLIAPMLAPGGRYVGLDVDPENLAIARQRLASVSVPVDLVNCNFAFAAEALAGLGIDRVDLLLADLGVASNQLDRAERGLSFQNDGPLDMRLDPRLGQTAADLVNERSERELADLIFHYGQDRLSRKIARKIVEQRRDSPIKSTLALAQLVRRVYGRSGRKRSGASARPRIDPATRTFMALRIAVNGELEVLDRLLADLPRLLRPGAVAAVISFHSLEDRPVKRAFANLVRAGRGERLTAKPLVADEQERHVNPRSRSAKLRAIRWIDGDARSGDRC